MYEFKFIRDQSGADYKSWYIPSILDTLPEPKLHLDFPPSYLPWDREFFCFPMACGEGLTIFMVLYLLPDGDGKTYRRVGVLHHKGEGLGDMLTANRGRAGNAYQPKVQAASSTQPASKGLRGLLGRGKARLEGEKSGGNEEREIGGNTRESLICVV